MKRKEMKRKEKKGNIIRYKLKPGEINLKKYVFYYLWSVFAA